MRQQTRQVHQATVDAWSHDGRGIARIDGKATFIEGAIPGETVSFTYTNRKKDYDEGRLCAILSPSPDRITPRCVHADICGGCSLQHMAPETQIEVKQTLLLNSLTRIGRVTPNQILPPMTDTAWHYRHRARLSVRYVPGKGGTIVGFREKNSPRYVANITQCEVLHTTVDKQLPALRALINQFQQPESVVQIEVAVAENATSIIIRHVLPLTTADKEALLAFGEATGFWLYVQPKGPDSVTRFYPEASSTPDWLTYTLLDGQIELRYAPTDFTQIHAKLNTQLVSAAMNWLSPTKDDVVLDLFCGLGNFSLPLATRAGQVIGVEGSADMVKRAAMNAEHNRLDNASFYAMDLNEPHALSSLTRRGITQMLLDPPRLGALSVVESIDKIYPEKILYISCNPSTLARDAHVLVHQKGYTCELTGVMDMFPHTTHVESMALFTRRKP